MVSDTISCPHSGLVHMAGSSLRVICISSGISHCWQAGRSPSKYLFNFQSVTSRLSAAICSAHLQLSLQVWAYLSPLNVSNISCERVFCRSSCWGMKGFSLYANLTGYIYRQESKIDRPVSEEYLLCKCFCSVTHRLVSPSLQTEVWSMWSSHTFPSYKHSVLLQSVQMHPYVSDELNSLLHCLDEAAEYLCCEPEASCVLCLACQNYSRPLASQRSPIDSHHTMHSKIYNLKIAQKQDSPHCLRL